MIALNEGGLDIVVRQEFGLALWWAIGLALVFGILPRARVRIAKPALVAVAVLAGLTALSLLWTESQERTVMELNRISVYAGLIALAALSVGRENWRAPAAGLCTVVLVLPALALFTRLAPDVLPVGLAGEFERLTYPLGYWNAVACWCAMAIAVALSLSTIKTRPALSALAMASLPIAGSALYLTYSRGGLAAAAVGAAVALALSRHRLTIGVHAIWGLVGTAGVIAVIRSQPEIANATGAGGGELVALALAGACAFCSLAPEVAGGRSRVRERWRRGAIPALTSVAGAAVLLILAIAWEPGRPGERIEDPSATPRALAVQEDPATRLANLSGARGEIWGSALAAFSSNVLKGTGPGTFDFFYNRDVPGGEPVRDAHSLPLETLAELGLLGGLALAGLLAALAVPAVRATLGSRRSSDAALRASLAAAFAVFVFQACFDWMWESTAVASTAILAAAIAGFSPAERRSRRGGSHARVAGLVLGCVALGAFQIPGVVSTERVRAAATDLAIGRDRAALESANEAVAAEPWAASPYALRAFVNLERSALSKARDDVREAIDREPTNWKHRLLEARILRALGDPTGSEEALDEALRLRPVPDLESGTGGHGADRPAT